MKAATLDELLHLTTEDNVSGGPTSCPGLKRNHNLPELLWRKKQCRGSLHLGLPSTSSEVLNKVAEGGAFPDTNGETLPTQRRLPWAEGHQSICRIIFPLVLCRSYDCSRRLNKAKNMVSLLI